MKISATAFKWQLAFRRRIKRTTAALASASRLRPGFRATRVLGVDSAPHHVYEGHYLYVVRSSSLNGGVRTGREHRLPG